MNNNITEPENEPLCIKEKNPFFQDYYDDYDFFSDDDTVEDDNFYTYDEDYERYLIDTCPCCGFGNSGLCNYCKYV